MRDALEAADKLAQAVIDSRSGHRLEQLAVEYRRERAALAARSEPDDIACNCANGDGTTHSKYHAASCPIALAARSEPGATYPFIDQYDDARSESGAEGLREALAAICSVDLRPDFEDGDDIILRWPGNKADWERARAALAETEPKP